MVQIAVQVRALDDAGTLDTTFSGTVTVTLGENPGRDTLSGTRTVDAQKGVATFAGLSLNKAGTGYTLVATAPGVRGTTSAPFDVTPAAAASLAFTTPPHGAVAGSVITPAVQVAAFDTLGNAVTTFTTDVTIALGTNPTGAVLGGAKTTSPVDGVATFSDLTVSEAGTGYTLVASAGDLKVATSDPFAPRLARATITNASATARTERAEGRRAVHSLRCPVR